MRYLSLAEVLRLHARVLELTGGSPGIRSLGIVESAVAQPKATFNQTELYPTVAEKAAALCFALIQGHGFVDGNKRVAHASLEVFLILNRYELAASVDEQETFFLSLADGQVARAELVRWIETHALAVEGPA